MSIFGFCQRKVKSVGLKVSTDGQIHCFFVGTLDSGFALASTKLFFTKCLAPAREEFCNLTATGLQLSSQLDS